MSRAGIYAGKAVVLIKATDLTEKTIGAVQRRLAGLNNQLGQLGRTSFTTGFFSATGQGILIRRFAKFDDLMLELRVKMGLLKDVTQSQEMEFSRLEKRIRALGKSTSYTTQEVAEGAIRLAQAGFSGKEIEDTLQSVLDLARGTSTDLANSARVLANTIRTFNLETESANQIVSQFVKASRMGTVEIDDLAEGLKYSSATAVELGQSLSTVLAVFTLLSERGMRGSIAGTSFNTAMANMAKKAEDISKMTGLPVPTDANGNLLLVDMIKQLEVATRSLPGIERVKVFQDLFNLRGSRAALALAHESDIQKLIQLAEGISMAGDEARRAAEIMDSRLGGAARRALSALEDLNITLQKIVAGPLTAFLNALPPLINLVDKFALANQNLLMGIMAMPLALAAGGLGLMVFSRILGTAAKTLGGLKSSIGFLKPLIYGGMSANVLKGLGGGAALTGRGANAAMGRLGQYPVGAASRVGSNIFNRTNARTWMGTMPVGYRRSMIANTMGPVTSSGNVRIPWLGSNGSVGNRPSAKQIAQLELQEQRAASALAAAAKRGDVHAAAREGTKRKNLQKQIAAAKNFKPTPLVGIQGKKLPFIPIQALQGAAAARNTSSVAYTATVAGKKGSMLGSMLKGLGGIGRGAKGLFDFSKAFGAMAWSVAKFATKTNVLLLALQVILMFGDRIPGVAGVLSRVSAAFGAFFATISTLAVRLGPVFQLFKMSIGLLGNEQTSDAGIHGLSVALQSLVGIVGSTLVEAWNRFKQTLGSVYNTIKNTVVVVWELGKALMDITINSLGNVIGGVLSTVGSRISAASQMMGAGGTDWVGLFKTAVAAFAEAVLKLFEWVGFLIMKLSNTLLDFIDDMHIMLLEVLGQAARMFGLTDTTGAPRETIRGQKGERNVQFRRDVMANEEAMTTAMRRIVDVLNSDSAGMAGQAADAAAANVEGILETVRRTMFELSNAGIINTPGSQNAGPGPLPPAQQIQAMRTAAMQAKVFAAALVGTAAGTRGNTIRAVTEDELKKQTDLLQEIRDNTAQQANAAFV